MMSGNGLKRIFLLRHGKSDWKTGDMDHGRPLASRGRRDADMIGQLMAGRDWNPELVLCSTAARTRQTIDRVSTSAGWTDPTIVYHDELYLAAPESVLRMIQSIQEEVSSVLVVGHQPFTSIVASFLLDGLMLDVPTACLVVVDCPATSWTEVGVLPGRLIDHILPRTLS
ncbi:MAG: histidine phosphatase family protein [Bacteroidetes bacterium]|nr:histidine phosphatase family protein [Bacteroidota bacterium]